MEVNLDEFKTIDEYEEEFEREEQRKAKRKRMETRKMENKALAIIPKSERYVKYMLDVMFNLPRTEKYSIGTDFKNVMYDMIKQVVHLSKVDMEKRYDYSVEIDALVQIQRIYLRLMYDNRWINSKRFDVAMDMLGEIGRINGGLIKYYAKNYKK